MKLHSASAILLGLSLVMSSGAHAFDTLSIAEDCRLKEDLSNDPGHTHVRFSACNYEGTKCTPIAGGAWFDRQWLSDARTTAKVTRGALIGAKWVLGIGSGVLTVASFSPFAPATLAGAAAAGGASYASAQGQKRA